MANRECNVTKRVQTPRGLRYCPVVLAGNGRIKPDVVIVDDREQKHPEGAYYLEWREGTKRVRLSVGNDAAEANARRQRKEAELNARNNGLTLSNAEANGRRSLSAAVTDYLAEIKLTKKPKTLAAYTTALDYFTESCHRMHVEDIVRNDMLKFAAFLRDEELHPRTCWNKFSNVMGFLKWCGIRGLVKKNDWPVYTEEVPEIYEQDDLDALFAVCDADERMWFEFFLGTGMREQEVMYLEWRDVNLRTATVSVKHKPRVWEPKAYKERDIPISKSLVERLKAWKNIGAGSEKWKVPAGRNGGGAPIDCHENKGEPSHQAGRCELVFATKGCKPKLDFLDCLKAVAERAELDKADWWLHKFRATFATRLLRALGGDFASGQRILGHNDVASTMRYWRPADNAAIREAINRI